jgi:hypothetical protein
MSGIYFEKLDARWHDFAELTLKGIPFERHAVCHAAFLVGAATLCNVLSGRPDKMTAEEIEEFFADVETACTREAAQYRRRTADARDGDAQDRQYDPDDDASAPESLEPSRDDESIRRPRSRKT